MGTCPWPTACHAYITQNTFYGLEGTFLSHFSPGGCGQLGAGESDLAILLINLSPSGGVTGGFVRYSVCVSCTDPLNPSPSGRHSPKSVSRFSLCVCLCSCVCVCVIVCVCVCVSYYEDSRERETGICTM
jgi:hypothetical protein